MLIVRQDMNRRKLVPRVKGREEGGKGGGWVKF